MTPFLTRSSRLASFVVVLNLFSEALGAFQHGLCWKGNLYMSYVGKVWCVALCSHVLVTGDLLQSKVSSLVREQEGTDP